jgi:hypothetical protein
MDTDRWCTFGGTFGRRGRGGVEIALICVHQRPSAVEILALAAPEHGPESQLRRVAAERRLMSARIIRFARASRKPAES